ncbi:MAG: hypothetical protein AAF810_16890 [Cyanobacteria bacterium P01_D01_bin.36]
MPEQPVILSEDEQPKPAQTKDSPLTNFLIGAFFGCLPAGVGLDLSSYMTHTPWLDYEVWQLALAASIPLMTGALGVVLKGKFLKALGDVMSSTIV